MRYLVLGSSLRGLDAAASTLAEEGHEVMLYDAEHPGLPTGVSDTAVDRMQVASKTWDADLLDDVDRIVTSPWFPETAPPLSDALDRGVDIVTEAGLGLERITMPHIAITGTNGKTTVTEVTTRMLVASGVDAVSAGNIGAPVSSLGPDERDVIVLELSSYQLRFIGHGLSPDAAALLNIAPDHLDWHGSWDAYVAAKARIVSTARPDTVFAFPAGDPVVSPIAEDAQVRAIPCSGRSLPPGGNGVDGDLLVVHGDRYRTAVTDETYRFDLVVAATLALACGATPDGVASVTESFEPGRHRRESVGIVDGVVYVNDSKATNPHATMAAAEAYDSVVLLVGGRNKGVDLAPLATLDVKSLIAFGEAAAEIAAASTKTVPVAGTLEEAVGQAAAVAEPGDTVLLSPGCASFDEFRSYEERGDAFRSIVAAMGEERP